MIYWHFLLLSRTSLKIPQPCSLTTEFWWVVISIGKQIGDLTCWHFGRSDASSNNRRLSLVSLLFYFLFFLFFSRQSLLWQRSQAFICSQGKCCCPGEQKSPSASSQQWPTHRLAVSQTRNMQTHLVALHFNWALFVCAPQVALGISTLLLYVPTSLAATHQSGSVALLSLAIWVLAELRKMPK